MSTWDVKDTADGLRLSPRRSLATEEFTWADLLRRRLLSVQVYVLYFPSRFDLEVDGTARSSLEAFGRSTSSTTAVAFWDPTDPEFGRALGFFDLSAPPAVVLVSGLAGRSIDPAAPEKTSVYAVTLADPACLAHRERLAAAINVAHEVLLRGDPQEISRYVRERKTSALLGAIGNVAGELRDQVIKLHPKFGLPGGISIQIG